MGKGSAGSGLQVRLKQQGPIPLDVDLHCAPGEVLALVGPSGSGKTTVLRSIAGLYRVSEGKVAVNGKVWLDTRDGIDYPPHRRQVGLVFQNYALFPHMSALDNVATALGHLPRAARSMRSTELMRLVGLDGLVARKPAELSGGQQQRVAVARALARDPDVLLLDEPFAAVDRVTRHKLYGELKELSQAFPIPTIVVTHDFDEAARVANRMCLLDRGAILQTGAPREVLARPISVQAARLVDLKNVFEGRIITAHGNPSWLDWNGRRLEVERLKGFTNGATVAWTIPGAQVLISRTDLSQSDVTPNRFAGTIQNLTQLSESLSATVILDGEDEPLLAMTLPAHYVRRSGLGLGSRITVALMPDGIHLMSLDSLAPSNEE